MTKNGFGGILADDMGLGKSLQVISFLLSEIETAGLEENRAILITSYELLRRDITVYEQEKFFCQIIDEAQYIKNSNTQSAKTVKLISSGFRLALTGTPVENRLSELWSIFDYLMPGFLYNYKRFREQIEQPIVKESDEQALTRLHRMIRPFVLRRLKQDVLKELPDKLEENKFVQMQGEQRARRRFMSIRRMESAKK